MDIEEAVERVKEVAADLERQLEEITVVRCVVCGKPIRGYPEPEGCGEACHLECLGDWWRLYGTQDLANPDD